MVRREIKEIESLSRGRYIRNIADIIPNWSDICSTADILKLSEIAPPIFKLVAAVRGGFYKNIIKLFYHW